MNSRQRREQRLSKLKQLDDNERAKRISEQNKKMEEEEALMKYYIERRRKAINKAAESKARRKALIIAKIKQDKEYKPVVTSIPEAMEIVVESEEEVVEAVESEEEVAEVVEPEEEIAEAVESEDIEFIPSAPRLERQNAAAFVEDNTEEELKLAIELAKKEFFARVNNKKK